MIEFLTILLALLATIFCWSRYFIRGGRKGELIDKIPGPYAWPVIGNIGKFMVSLEQIWDVSREINMQYYPISRIWSVFVPVINLQHPDDVEALLSNVKHIEKSLLYQFLHPWLNTGLLTSKDAKWHERRKILTPAFHFNVLRQFAGIFIEQSNKLVESLCSDDAEVIDDLVALLHKFTLNSICETAMGFKSELGGQVLKEYRSCVSDMGDIMLHRVTRPWLHTDWLFKFSKKFKAQTRALKVLHGFSTKIIKERKQYHEETEGRFLKGLGSSDSNLYSFEEEEHVKGKRRLAMLDLMISASQNGANIDDDGIREEVDTFVFEGHDTTAMALCFMLMLLAENTKIQDKARAEIDEVFGTSEGGKLTLQEIQSLSYVERCIKESLRLFPSVPFISRHVSEDLQLKKYLIPGGTVVHVFIWDLHRDANFWPNPNVFDPDRFLPENVQGRHPFAYIPFSAGPRNCIGQRFAMLELKAFIGTFLHNFYLEAIDLSSDVRLLPDLVLRAKHPIRMKIIRRSHDN